MGGILNVGFHPFVFTRYTVGVDTKDMNSPDETSNFPAAARGLAPCEDTLIRDALSAPQIRAVGYYLGPAIGDHHEEFPSPTDRLWFAECYGRKFAVMARTSADAFSDFRSAETSSKRVAFAQGGSASIVGLHEAIGTEIPITSGDWMGLPRTVTISDPLNRRRNGVPKIRIGK